MVKRGIFLAILLLLCSCSSLPSTPQNLSGWQEIARRRNLTGESAAKLSRWQQLAANDRRRQELPDLLHLVKNTPQKKAVELSLDILREAVAIASIRLIPENDTPLAAATRLCSGEIDCLTATMLAEKSFLDSDVWKRSDSVQRETELHRELIALLGKVPLENIPLETPHPTGVTPLPAIISKNYGSDPAVLLKFANAILAMPGEFARQLINDPQAKITGIWQEAHWHAAICAVHFSEKELHNAFNAYKSDPSAANTYRWRKWFYRRKLALSAVPLIRGSESDIRALEALIQLHNYL